MLKVKPYSHILNLGFSSFTPATLISTPWFVYVCFGSKGSILEKLSIIDLEVACGSEVSTTLEAIRGFDT